MKALVLPASGHHSIIPRDYTTLVRFAMAISKQQIALLHVAKSQLGLDDDLYRDILFNTVGVRSSKELTAFTFKKILARFEELGFTRKITVGQSLGERPHMATPNQIDYIKSMWCRYAGVHKDRELDHWLSRCFGISSLRFIDVSTAGKAIVALKNMTRRTATQKRRTTA